jgi:ribosomal protein L11 methyltransferase
VIRLALRVRREDAEVALAELLELVPGGVEEVDLGDRVEYAIYGAPGELPALPDLEAAAGDALVEVRTTEVADDWDERWKRFHEPVEVAGLRVRPPWSEGRAGDIVIDPGQAFGTGGHRTTRLCLELLAGLDAPGGTFADLGCGSGVLAIAAARLGFGPVVASGLLTSEADEAAAALAAHGLVEVERRSAAEWSALLLRRP